MPIHIRNREAEALARELAAMTGESITDTILHSLEERIARERKRQKSSGPRLRDEILAIGRWVSRLPVLDDRSIDAVLGYDDDGLPG